MGARTFNKEILRTVTHSWGRFIAVFAIVALGVGFYAGLRMTAPDMRLAADAFYDETNLMDIRVVSTMGLDEADLDELRSLDGVERVSGAFETDVIADIADEPYAIRVHSLPYATSKPLTEAEATQAADEAGGINDLILEEGRWPTSNNECILSADRIMNQPLALGDTLTVTECSTGLDDTLEETTYTVVGLAHSSYYASSTSLGSTTLGSGLIQQFMFVPSSDFDPSFPITEAFLLVDGARAELSGSFDYQNRIDEVLEEIAGIESVQEQARLRTIKDEAQQELDEARADFESERAEAYAQLDEAQVTLDEAARRLEESERELASGERSYEEGKRTLASERANAESEFAAAQEVIDEKRQLLDAAGPELEQGKAALDAAWANPAFAPWGVTPDTAQQALTSMRAALDHLTPGTPEYRGLAALIGGLESLIERQATYDKNKKDYDDGIVALEQGVQDLTEGRAEASRRFAAAQSEIDAAYQKIADGRSQLESGRRDYEQGRADYEEQRARAEQELADAEAKLDDAQTDINALEMPEWLVMDRTKNYGAESFDMDAGRVDSIAMVFPFVFFLVAALVALTTMTRMVDEERMQIGTYKALGYSRARITSKYLIYAGAASLLGSVVGIALLSFSLPAIIMVAYSIVYIVPTAALALDWPIALSATGLGVGITLLATMAAALSTLRESPAALMQPKAPKAGKRILLERIRPVWRHLSFLWKVTCRNIFRYKKRLCMTVIGIAGCTALLLTGFGLQDSINDIIDKHYGELIDYNMVVVSEDDASEDDRLELENTLADSGLVEKEAAAFEEPMVAQSANGVGSDLSVELIVPENVTAFSDIWLFRDRRTHAPVELGSDGAVVTEKVAMRFALGVGDEIVLATQDDMGNATNETYALPISGIIENYIGHDMFVDATLFERTFHETPTFDRLFVRLDATDEAREDVANTLRDLDAVKTVAFNDETIDMYKTALRSVNMVVVVLIVAAALLAFIVLYNLTNINITERSREIATLKVLGFTAKEIDRYIFREILILSVCGALVGLVLGVFLENFVVVTAEVDAVMFGRDIHWPSFVFSFVLTMLFTMVVALSMRGKLKRIDMVESLKSNE